MSLLIKGIDMPPDIEGAEVIIHIKSDGTVFDMREVHLQAQAVELPTPHGRLGDLDRLYKHIKAECNIYGKPTIGFEDGNKVLKIIADTPTVIEAEE